jgi:hypothetical protein
MRGLARRCLGGDVKSCARLADLCAGGRLPLRDCLAAAPAVHAAALAELGPAGLAAALAEIARGAGSCAELAVRALIAAWSLRPLGLSHLAAPLAAELLRRCGDGDYDALMEALGRLGLSEAELGAIADAVESGALYAGGACVRA